MRPELFFFDVRKEKQGDFNLFLALTLVNLHISLIIKENEIGYKWSTDLRKFVRIDYTNSTDYTKRGRP